MTAASGSPSCHSSTATQITAMTMVAHGICRTTASECPVGRTKIRARNYQPGGLRGMSSVPGEAHAHERGLAREPRARHEARVVGEADTECRRRVEEELVAEVDLAPDAH